MGQQGGARVMWLGIGPILEYGYEVGLLNLTYIHIPISVVYNVDIDANINVKLSMNVVSKRLNLKSR